MNKLQTIKRIVMLNKRIKFVNQELKIEYKKQIKLAFVKLIK
jgi:hypothetical protein